MHKILMVVLSLLSFNLLALTVGDITSEIDTKLTPDIMISSVKSIGENIEIIGKCSSYKELGHFMLKLNEGLFKNRQVSLTDYYEMQDGDGKRAINFTLLNNIN